MTFHTQQIQTDQGVLIGLPVSEWEKLMKEYKKFKEKEAFEKRLTASFKEIKEIEAGRKKAMTLKEFLDEF